jgi:hypothetical protein
VFIIGFIGLVGTCKGKGCCITIYNIFNLIFAGLMVVLALFFIIYFSKIKKDIQKSLLCKDGN